MITYAMIMQCGIKLLIHYQILTLMYRLGKDKDFSFTLLGILLHIHFGFIVNPC